MYDRPATLECQDCGDVVWVLSMAEQQKVADKPYNYVVFCGPCGEVNARMERFHDY